MLGQNSLQSSTRSVQLHLRRALRNTKGHGDCRLREIVDVPQEQQLTVMRGQIPNRSAHVELERQEIEAPGGRPIVDVSVLIEADRDRAASPVTVRLAMDDRAQPRDRMLGDGPVAEAAPGADQRLLSDVGGIVGGGDATRLSQASTGRGLPVELPFGGQLRTGVKRF